MPRSKTPTITLEEAKARFEGLRSGFRSGTLAANASRSYRGRAVTAEDILFIRRLITDNPRLSRRKLSSKLCEAWNWKQANGALRDMVCRGLLLTLHRAGEIELPAVRQVSLNPFVRREKPQPVLIDMTADRRTDRSAPDLSSTGKENVGRTTVQLSDRTSSLPWL
jgi:hypothetical protein